jgi:hypothetical protein
MRKPIIVIGVASVVVAALGVLYYLGTQTVQESAEKELAEKEPASNPPPAPTAPPRPLALGESVDFEHGSLRVYDYQDDVQANTGFGPILEPGNKFSAIDVEGCNRDSDAGISIDALEFSLSMPDNTRVQPTGLPAVQPDMHNPVTLQRGECIRGWLSFQVPQETSPTIVLFNSKSGSTARWDI